MSLGQYLFKFSRQHGTQRTCEFLSQGRKEKKIADAQIQLRDLAEAFGGPQWAQTLKPARRVQESGGAHASAIDPSAFAAIGGQLLIDEVAEGYGSAEFVIRNLIDEAPITNGNLGDQIVPWMSGVEDDPDEIQPGMPYPHTRFGSQYYTLGPPKKWGLKCLVLEETIFANQTLDVMQGARSVGNRVRAWEEKQSARVVYGIDNPYRWNGTGYNTYLTSGAWINKKSGVTLSDWTQLQEAEQLLAEMVDPATGEPTDIKATTLLVQPWKLRAAQFAVSSSTIYSGVYPTSGTPAWTTEGANPMQNQFNVVASRYGYRALINEAGLTAAQAKEVLVLADFKRAFVWRYAKPFETWELPPDSLLKWNQDVMFGVKARTWGSCGVRDPRRAVYVYNT